MSPSPPELVCLPNGLEVLRTHIPGPNDPGSTPDNPMRPYLFSFSGPSSHDGGLSSEQHARLGAAWLRTFLALKRQAPDLPDAELVTILVNLTGAVFLGVPHGIDGLVTSGIRECDDEEYEGETIRVLRGMVQSAESIAANTPAAMLKATVG